MVISNLFNATAKLLFSSKSSSKKFQYAKETKIKNEKFQLERTELKTVI